MNVRISTYNTTTNNNTTSKEEEEVLKERNRKIKEEIKKEEEKEKDFLAIRSDFVLRSSQRRNSEGKMNTITLMFNNKIQINNIYGTPIIDRVGPPIRGTYFSRLIYGSEFKISCKQRALRLGYY